MVARVVTVAFEGVEARRVDVEVQLTSGEFRFNIVGLGDKAVAESRERVRAAFAGLGLALPGKHIVVNLAPADLPKEGSHYDLPIALGDHGGMGVIPPDCLDEWAALGELGLDGRIAPVAGVLPAAVAASGFGLGLICPEASGPEAAWAGDCRVIAPRSLISLVNHFRGRRFCPRRSRARRWTAARSRTCATSRARRAANGRWRSPRPAATTSSSSARRDRASPCSHSACRAFCRRFRPRSCWKPRWCTRSRA